VSVARTALAARIADVRNPVYHESRGSMGHISPNSRGARLHVLRRPWRRLVVGAAFVAALAFAGFALSGGFTVELGPSGPGPQTVTVGWGDTLAFVNTDTVAHGITSSRPELNMPTIAAGSTFTTIITGRTATYAYRQTGGGRSRPASIVSHVTGSVSLKASKSQLLYGQSVQLSGVASLPATPVSLQQRLRGQHGWKQLSLLESGDDGSYKTTYKPSVGAKYRTTIAGGQIVSKLASVTVTPKLTIASQAKKAKAGHKVTITSRLTPGNAGTQVTLLQCNTAKGAWKRVAGKRPSKSGGVTFYWAAEAGKNYLKTTVTRPDSAAGYVPPTSSEIQIVGIAKAAPKTSKKHKHQPKPPKSC
jgi:plastocyanin